MQPAVTEVFARRFGGQPRVFRAPGRVNLIGEHTDYNDGFVMPTAISFDITVAVAPRDDGKLRLFSEGFDGIEEIELAAARPRGRWTDYVAGVALLLERAGIAVAGADMLVRGSVPMGSGLSSSAALEVASGFALAAIAGTDIDKVKLARLAQAAENDFVGMRCGIMDQFISSCGVAGRALMLDCRSLEFSLVPIPDDVRVIIVNSMVKHALAGSAYNERRAECEAGMRVVKSVLPNAMALRDVELDWLRDNERLFDPVVFERCRHVVAENARVLEAAACLSAGDVVRFGDLMWQSHASLRDDYGVSCKELDVLVDLAREAPGVLGSRMTGGGFGGCTVSLVRSGDVDDFTAFMRARYERAVGKVPDTYVCVPSQGVHEV